ncbi:hypothetical protein ACFX11_046819 [Malus domestica]
MTKEKDKHFRDPARPRTLRGVVAVLALLAKDLVLICRGEVVYLLEVRGSRDREILVVQVDPVLPYTAGVIISILGSVGEAVMDVLLVDKWAIGLRNALRVSRNPSSLLSHHLNLLSKLQDLVVILRLDEEVLTTIKATPLLTPRDSRSTLRILSIRMDILSIREDLCLISHIQMVDLSGIKGDNPSRERLLLVV